MALLRLLLLLVLCIAPRAARADAPSWELGAGLWSTSSVAFPKGFAAGGLLEGRRHLPGPFFASLRTAAASSAEANRHWEFIHRYVILEGAAGVQWRLGAARVWAQAGAGAMLVQEEVRRHQFQRLEAIGLNARTREGWSLGPRLHGEAGVALSLRGEWYALFGGGPVHTMQRVGGETRGHLGWSSRLGVSHAF